MEERASTTKPIQSSSQNRLVIRNKYIILRERLEKRLTLKS